MVPKKNMLYAVLACLMASSMAWAGGGMAPVKQGHVDIGVEGLYMKANQNTESFFTDEIVLTPEKYQMNLLYRDVKAELGWGVFLGYTFANDADLRLSYRHLRAKSQGDGADDFESVTSSSQWRYDAFNIDLGKSFMPIAKLHLRPFLGVGYRNVKQVVATDQVIYGLNGMAIDAFIYGLDDELVATDQSKKFKGIGPRVGLDALYEWNSNIGLVGGAVLTALYGSVDIHQTTVLSNVLFNDESLHIMNTPHPRYLVPELDMNLGIRFMGGADDGTHYGLELGYRVVHLWDVFSMGHISDFFNREIVGSGQTQTLSQNVSFNGPYLKASISF